MRVFNFGSINIDAIYRVAHLVQPGETISSQSLTTVLGGKGANQSVALARAGVDVLHVGCVGKSDQWAVEALKESGVNCSEVHTIDASSGHAIIQVDDSGENAIVLHGGANQVFSRRRLQDALSTATEEDYLLIQNECNALPEAMAIALERGMSVVFNPAPMTSETLKLPLDACAALILNEVEAAQISGESSMDAIRDSLQQQFPQTDIVLTLGSDGAELMSNGESYRQRAFAVDVVDTTGAGDTFVGYYLASLLTGLTPEAALGRACSAAALSVAVVGATPSIPTAAAVDQFQQEHS